MKYFQPGWPPQRLAQICRLCILTLTITLHARTGVAQNQGGQGQGGGPGGGGGQNQNGQFPGGIAISPEGVIAGNKSQRINPALEQKRLKALAGANLPTPMTAASELRKVSLVKLEIALQQSLDRNNEVSPELKFLAGLTQIDYLFAMPETGDIVIAGPAEGFAPMQDGRAVGVETGRPVLVLDDLLTILRLDNLNQTLGCSFDPDPGRLAKANAWNKSNNSPASRAVAQNRFYQMAKVLGNWDVTVFGLPAGSHAAVSAVEADFQLKLLALGLRKPRVRGFKSHLELAKPAENMMRRWWFAPLYNVIERSSDGTAFRLSGPRLQLMTQDELVDAQGNRSDAAFKEISTEKYTVQFNRHLPDLCRETPSFAAIQNLFDIAIVAALINQHRLTETTKWTPNLLLDSERLPIAEYRVPKEVPSLVNVRPLGSRLILGLIGGGVTMIPTRVINRTTELPVEEIPRIADVKGQDSWWWD